MRLQAVDETGRPDAPTHPERGDPAVCLQVAVPAPDLEPADFLRAARGAARGFWESEGRWAAFSGALAELDSRTLPAGELAEQLRRLAWSARAAPDDAGPARTPIRVFGGFAFRSRWRGCGAQPPTAEQGPGSAGEPLPGRPEDRLWEEFPAARFVLPAFELAGGPEGVWLRHRAPLRHGDGRGELAEALRESLDRFRRSIEQARERRSDPLPEVVSVQEAVEWTAWRRSVGRVLERIREREVEKVVLARAVDVRLAAEPDPVTVLQRLRAGNPDASSFLFEFAPGAAFLGAAPELLGALSGEEFRTMAVAGSAPRGKSAADDEGLGHRLLTSRKDRLEHAICVRELEERLGRAVRELRVDPEPRLQRLADIQHLRTDLVGRVRERVDLLTLLADLHPTAAVCGYPRDAAVEVLDAEEPLRRGWYAGAIGWIDSHGDGEFVPGLRSAALRGRLLRLYAGAGLVEGSRAEAEWEETRVKLQTVSRALGVSEVP